MRTFKTHLWSHVRVAAVVAVLATAGSGLVSGATPSPEPPLEPAIELAAPFRDNAILQRGVKVPVWGWGEPGESITVRFAGQEKTAEAAADGRWMIDLDPLKASADGAELTVRAADRTVVLKNILVGEVWHASGQSNMEWIAGKSLCRDLAGELARANAPIREFRTDTVSALYPQKRVGSEHGWKMISSASQFSALSLAFAHELHKELKVPIGILLTSHSNTRVEAFTERKAIEAHPELKEDADLIHNGDVTTAQGRAAFEQYYRDLAEWQNEAAKLGFPVERPLPRRNLPGIAGMWRGPTQFFNGKIAPVIPYAIRGSIWCQGTSNSNDSRIYAARMEALVNGWRAAWGMPEMPFYFTQMQCYGGADPNAVGFADIRQAQHLFFINNRENVGMVVQSDLNPYHPHAIHYANKLHPGIRLARWALAKDYGREIAFTGPIYSGYKVEANKVTVSFEKDSLLDGLMVGSKGPEGDADKYVEPARATPGEKLNHFRLCGADGKWHAAEAVIEGDTVVVRSEAVPAPTGVQYAYSGTPIGSNLYNKAGLPATPFAAVDGELIWVKDNRNAATPKPAKPDTKEAPERPYLHVPTHFSNGVIIQRGVPVPVWGRANAGDEVKVTLGDVTLSAKADERRDWSVSFPAMEASSKPRSLTIETSRGRSKKVEDILVGDVWYLTGNELLRSEMAYNPGNEDAGLPSPMPLVREFKRNSMGNRSATPRKGPFSVGGRYGSYWLTADWSMEKHGVTMFAYHFAKALDRPDVPQGFITMTSGQGGRLAFMASPLSWTSYDGVKDVTRPSFRKRLDALHMQDPASKVARKATAEYVETVKARVRSIAEMGQTGVDMSTAPLGFPGFPQGNDATGVVPDMIPTYAYNWCVSPLTPMAVAGVVWIPSQANIGHTPADYGAELEVYAKSLPATYGQDQVPFFHAQPAASLVEGITAPNLPGAKQVTFDGWPGSLKELGGTLGRLAK